MAFFKKNEKYSDDNIGYDSITKLSNNEKLYKFFNKVSKSSDGFAYVYLNINNFKHVNNAFGYDTGNNVLKNILDTLQKNIGDDEIAVQLMADEYALLLKFDSKENFANRLIKIITCLENVGVTNGNVVFAYNCSFLCGICEITGNETVLTEIANMAYTAYNTIKKQHNLTYAFFDESMKENMQFISSLLPSAKEAFAKRQIIPYFQPNYEIKSKKIIGAEIFARWNHPKFGLIQPHDFIKVFERSGDILELDLYMLEEACKMHKKWIDDECMPVHLSVNISKFNLYEINFVDKVLSIIKRYEVPTSLINIEINAMVLLDNQEKAYEIMTLFHDNGFMLSVDNFGEQHVVLDVLYKFPINVLNLDHHFIEEAQGSEQIKNVLSCVISLCQQLEIIVSAKGIENVEQEAFLLKTKCQSVQGYFYCNPQPRDEFEKLIF